MTDFTNVKNSLAGFNLVQLDDIKKECVKLGVPLRKLDKGDKKAALEVERTALAELQKNIVKVNDIVSCTYKGKDILASVRGTNPTTITVDFLDTKSGKKLVKDDGKFATGWKYYWQFQCLESVPVFETEEDSE